MSISVTSPKGISGNKNAKQVLIVKKSEVYRSCASSSHTKKFRRRRIWSRVKKKFGLQWYRTLRPYISGLFFYVARFFSQYIFE